MELKAVSQVGTGARVYSNVIIYDVLARMFECNTSSDVIF
jgi:hypothetical protein